jgi:MFS transporter, NNP family, nitrate/nitrite transporter
VYPHKYAYFCSNVTHVENVRVSRFFANNVVGAANAISAGWGNLGGGVTHLVMGSLLFPLFKVFFNGDANLAWRYCFIVPAVIAVITGVVVYFISDDAPKGNYAEMKKNGTIPEISAGKSFRKGAFNFNSWLLFAQYAACFGVELTMTNGAAIYFHEEFKQSTESAAAIASIFGWMNLFARGLGGFLSDKANAKMGMRGRLAFHFTCLFMEGIFIFIFANTHNLGAAIAVLVFFSLFVQFADGTSFSIVPYVDPTCTGSVSGIVGAGGNVGAVVFGLGFRQMNYKNAFYLMGGCVLAISLTCFCVKIKDCSSLILGGSDAVPEQKEVYDSTLAVPDAKKDDIEDVEDAEVDA